MRIGFQIVKFVEVESVENIFRLFRGDRSLSVVELDAVALKANTLSLIGRSLSSSERH